MLKNSYIRTRNIFDPVSGAVFKLSRSMLENFTRCPRCFYLDRRLGVAQPSMPSFTLNTAVDHLLKKEFDIYRAKGKAHPLMKQYGVDAVPLAHPDMDKWRENFVGVQYFHELTNLIITGAVDDLWVNPAGEFIVVDYKATSTDKEITLEGVYKEGYKRQMEIYQWLLRSIGHRVADIGYFVYVNGRRDKEAFDGKLEFRVQLIPHHGNASWVEKTVFAAHTCLMASGLPASSPECEYCRYRESAREVVMKFDKNSI
ncbi:MAG: hypothetical protein A3I44_03390 [Candidatus Sungbacteria bacterium RIFCSPLOWO2_02_FULL_51_17]|uniref:PD-(D/E)XK endonuclease-like domain-containing protein n=1 Tax=Candidatus Sungbacteria bacterium RIFCSPHIGHO2_02_FULL_51_29 TaxID=1802273 RepID=A0A1G2KUH5_9BACT|nr:MAG: hypothetical protein A2676_01245 [Candidatus Sungbacteria bacterium RIFCSPHIGHO2_01_FULL_51_22]OHA02081.1 MAG: hypothetical protein A3C16_05640 [Candidatus Sungbacteria bacterium RIFCSPHIGHO2_02_FULL_51_29]OHA04607.1 MAG: hypothetical protein A3B29_04460 [Candidatus Sungbacteria bacterium RIFCSPLOWO2_01_FULL_51_34]OHA12294.1 MAG: hypothetical protein A3I44_03390 [Candidatus Sungbacteria bacterium RIFCSPLOWO2_02_FULL_51_17]